MSGRRLVLLYRDEGTGPLRASVRQHLDAILGAADGREGVAYNALKGVPRRLRAVPFDAIVFHPTFLGIRWSELYQRFREQTQWLASVDCVKIAMPQDDYDRPALLDEWLAELGVTHVLSVFEEPERSLLYPRLSRSAEFVPCLTGYVDDAAAARYGARVRPLSERPVDVGYRASEVPYRYGSHGRLKTELAEAALARAPAHDLVADISTKPEDVILGERWLDFLGSARTVLGCESGSSALDRSGELDHAIQRILAEDPRRTFAEVSALLPAGWDDYRLFALSPRHLEAVITGTPQILVEGRYQGVLEPGRHYLPLRRDLSDLDEVLEASKDVSALETVARRAYEDVYLSGAYTYRRLTGQVRGIVRAGASRGGIVRGATWRPGVASLEAGARAPRVVTRLVESPLGSIRKGLATAGFTVVSGPLRRLAVDYARDAEVRRTVTSHQLFADLLRLGVLQRRPFELACRIEDRGRRLKLESAEAPRGPGAVTTRELGSIETIVWNHSALGSSVDAAGAAGLAVGPGGVHRFDALAALARRHPQHVADALRSILSAR